MTTRREVAELRRALKRRDVDALDAALDRSSMTPAERGRLGGLRGGPARARALSPSERSEIARRAAAARWAGAPGRSKA